MPNQTTDAEQRRLFIDKMGEHPGLLFYALYKEVIALHLKWEFVELFGTKPSRVELFNQAAPSFVGMVENALHDDTLLHISRLTDSRKGALRIRNLTSLALHRDPVHRLVEIAKEK